MKNLIYLIEGPGKAKDLIEEHMAELQVNRTALWALLDELGATRYNTYKEDGTLHSVALKKPREDFTKPDKQGYSRPKHKTEWAKRFKDLPKYRSAAGLIHKELGVPGSMGYSNSVTSGSRTLGMPLRSCGFLWITDANLYAFWTPDVQSEVQDYINRGYTVTGPAANWVPSFEGCRHIEEEEWTIKVAQHELENKRKGIITDATQ